MRAYIPYFVFALVLGVPAVSAATVPVNVPEPSTTALLLIAGAGAAAFRKLRNRLG